MALVALALAVAGVAPALAASNPMIEGGNDLPETAQVGSSINGEEAVTFTASNLYENYDSWTLVGDTELEQPTWTITLKDNKGNKIDQRTVTEGQFTLDIGGDVTTVQITLDGKVPEASNYSYEPAHQFALATFSQRHGNSESELKSWTVRPSTEASREARTALDEAKAAIDSGESAGVDVSKAKATFDSAVSAYESGNFPNAQSLAERAESEANDAQSSKQQTNLVLMVGGGVVVLLVLAGLVYWFLSNRQTHDRLG